VKLGDFLIFYLKPKRLGGIFKVASKIFESDRKIFNPAGVNNNEKFRRRFRVDPITVLKKSISFVELIKEMKFITNRRHW
jgi:predicted RNA-binding protein